MFLKSPSSGGAILKDATDPTLFELVSIRVQGQGRDSTATVCVGNWLIGCWLIVICGKSEKSSGSHYGFLFSFRCREQAKLGARQQKMESPFFGVKSRLLVYVFYIRVKMY